MKNDLIHWSLVPLLMVFLHGGVGELPAQQKASGEDELKSLVVRKFDVNLDKNLSAAEKANAVAFLEGLDKNGDGQISLSERTAAIGALNKMVDPAEMRGTEKMTVENRSVAKRTASDRSKAWGEFIKSLPHGGGSRTFTTMPGTPGFDIKGEKDVDLTAENRRGPAPDVPKVDVKDLREKLMKERAEEAARQKRQAKAAPKDVVDKVAKSRAKSYYDGTVILVSGQSHAVVPKGAVLNIPPALAEMISEEPKGELIPWPKFLKNNSKFFNTREVSWDTITGKDPIQEEEKEEFVKAEKIVVAVFHKNPVTVLDPPPKKEEEAVAGAVASDSGKKKK